MRSGPVKEAIKQLPAILASCALLVTALQGCQKSEKISEQKKEILELEVTQTNLAEQIKSISTLVPDQPYFE
jgi:hypothetical protein